MSRQSREEDQVLKDLFQRSSSTPDEALKKRILEEVSLHKEVFEYQPVIGRNAWIAILSGLVLTMICLVVYDSLSNISRLKNEWFSRLSDWSLPDGLFKMSFELSLPTLPYPFVIACLALIIFGLYFIISIKYHEIRFGGGKK